MICLVSKQNVPNILQSGHPTNINNHYCPKIRWWQQTMLHLRYFSQTSNGPIPAEPRTSWQHGIQHRWGCTKDASMSVQNLYLIACGNGWGFLDFFVVSYFAELDPPKSSHWHYHRPDLKPQPAKGNRWFKSWVATAKNPVLWKLRARPQRTIHFTIWWIIKLPRFGFSR